MINKAFPVSVLAQPQTLNLFASRGIVPEGALISVRRNPSRTDIGSPFTTLDSLIAFTFNL